MSIEAVVGIVCTLAGFGAGIAVNVAIVARLAGRLEAKVDGMDARLIELAGGKGPICSNHETRLNEHERRLNDHDQRLKGLGG